jgi:hypothetical protein
MRPEEVFTILSNSPFGRVDVNHDGENVGRPDVSAQSECEPLQ